MSKPVPKKLMWREVKLPKIWQPSMIDQELKGTYLGRTLRYGSFGQYEVVLLQTAEGEYYIVSGTDIIQRVDVSGIEEGHLIRIVWKGRKPLSEGRYKKMFELYVWETA